MKKQIAETLEPTSQRANLNMGWIIVSDGNLLTFTTSYGFIKTYEVVCTMDINVPVNETPTTHCTLWNQ